MPSSTRRSFLKTAMVSAITSLLSTSCSSPTATATTQARSNRPRQQASDVPQGDVGTLTTSINTFALDLYYALGAGTENLFFSPYSIAQVLTMALAGARSTTARQINEALHYTLPPERLRPAANAFNQALTTRAKSKKSDEFILDIADDLWGQTGYQFQPAFLDLLAEQYGAGLQLLDFKQSSEDARATINRAISDETHGKISDLFPPQSISTDSRLVLTNAVYFHAKWLAPFDKQTTKDEDFTMLDGNVIKTSMMHQDSAFEYGAGEGYQAIRLPYHGDMSMVVILPSAGQFAEFEAGLKFEDVTTIMNHLSSQPVILTMPKFGYKAPSFSLKATLMKLGMSDAFTLGPADFSGMDGTRNLFISDGYHQATITVDESGTEAAAATGLGMLAGAAPGQSPPQPVKMTIDHPFLFALIDDKTGMLCFIGRITDPRK